MHPNFLKHSKHEFRVQWCGSGAFVEKSSDTTSWHELLHYLHQFNLFCTEFSAVVKRSHVHPNIMKRTKTWVGPMVWIGHVRSDKFRRDFVTWTFALVAPDWPICTEFSAVRKHSQMHPNITKCNKNEFRVPWCVSRAFVEKSSDTTSWHELLH